MAGVLDLIGRFRPAGAPGPAGAAGVPADRRESVAAELAPVFAALAGVEEECGRVRGEAARLAAEQEAAAQARARMVVARARDEAAAERAAAAARAWEDTAVEVVQLQASTAAEADEARRHGMRRLPQQVSHVVAQVRAELAALDGADGGVQP